MPGGHGLSEARAITTEHRGTDGPSPDHPRAATTRVLRQPHAGRASAWATSGPAPPHRGASLAPRGAQGGGTAPGPRQAGLHARRAKAPLRRRPHLPAHRTGLGSLATVADLGSRRIVGSALRSRMLVAWAARTTRGAGWCHHPQRSGQPVPPSEGPPAVCDPRSAPVGWQGGYLRRQRHGRSVLCDTKAWARGQPARRLHSAIGHLSPVGHELRCARDRLAAAYCRVSSTWGRARRQGYTSRRQVRTASTCRLGVDFGQGDRYRRRATRA
jgi:hypothetical protein